MKRIAIYTICLIVLSSPASSQQKQAVNDEIYGEKQHAHAAFSLSSQTVALIKSFEMISNGSGVISATVGFDVTSPPVGHGAYSADWYRDVLQGAGSVLGLANGMQDAGGWYFVVAGPNTITDHDAAVNRWLRNGQNLPMVAGNSYELRFTQAGGKAFTRFSTSALKDVPFELWYLAATPDDMTDDVRMIPWIVDPEATGTGSDEFTFVLDHQASDGENDPFSSWIYWALPENRSPGQAGYDQFVQDATNGSYTGDADEEHLARLVLMNYDRHQGESTPGAGDGPVNAMPETGTTFRLTFEPPEEGPVFVVTNTNDSGAGSLRNAIIQANASVNADEATPDSIKFDIPGSGPHTISLQSPLPLIGDAVVLDGLTQPGASCESWPPTLAIVLDGSGAGSSAGLAIGEDSGSVIRGLVVHSFDGPGIQLSNTQDNVIQCNFIGTDVTGSVAMSNSKQAVNVSESSNNLIGGTAVQDRNLLSGNDFGGISLAGTSTTGNMIQGNLIGTDVSGSLALGNGRYGVWIESASNNIIGGTADGAGNLISGNGWGGVHIRLPEATGNLVQGNFVGTDSSGTAAIPNIGQGVGIADGASDNIIGGTEPGARNLLSGNAASGVAMTQNNTTGNQVLGNFIGTDVNGTSALPNSEPGVHLFLGASNNIIGGTASGAGNVISGNGSSGITIRESGTNGNKVIGNCIGVDVTGTAPLGNTGDGVVIAADTKFNIIGGSSAGEGNCIASNGASGLRIAGTSNTVQGNFVGTDSTGTVDIGNTEHGILIQSSDNLVGGPDSEEGNTIAFNGLVGVRLVSGTGNAILTNAVHANNIRGIDIGDIGVNVNDPGDADSGANNLQNSPRIGFSGIDENGDWLLEYGVDSNPDHSLYPIRVQIFEADASGQGKTFLVDDAFSDNDFKRGSKLINLGQAAQFGVAEGTSVVASATDGNGNTSEFSAMGAVRTSLTFTVNTIGDRSDANPGDGVCDDGLGNCTLRAAIDEANARAARDTIEFDISGPVPHTIRPESALPEITAQIFIDGTTEPDFAGTPVIELDGTNAGADASGLWITGGSSTVRGLVINRFGSTLAANGIKLDVHGNNVIQGNFVGTDFTGTLALGNRNAGVFITSSDNLVGGTKFGARNIISGNTAQGVTITGAGATRNLVQGNFIGTDLTGTTALGNVTGVLILARDNIIGGTSENAANIISGNAEGVKIDGIQRPATGNLIQGNYIGLQTDGISPLGNTLLGVRITESASDNLVGGIMGDAGNTIAFNGGNGVVVLSGTGNTIQSNSMFANQGIGIDLGDDGITQNDLGDEDAGTNNLQNFPDISSVEIASNGDLIISYAVSSDLIHSAYPLAIQFFESENSGEGKANLGTDTYTASDFAAAIKTVNLGSAGMISADSVIATATDNNGNTSEFSQVGEFFTKITKGDIVNGGIASNGGSWTDYDNDGDLDLYVVQRGSTGPGNNSLFQNHGSEFTKINNNTIVNDLGNSYGPIWGDYDNDSDLDLFVANAIAENFLYRNEGGGSFTKITETVATSDSGRSVGSSWVDIDNDGDLDLWVDNENLPGEPEDNNSLYRNNLIPDGAATFTQITEGEIVNDGGASIGSSWADFDSDGDSDLFVPNQSGQNNFMYRNNGDGSFTKITSGAPVNDGGNSKACSWADYDNDGDLDLFVANAGPSPGEHNFLYRNEGSGNFTRITTGVIVNDAGRSRGNGWADIDNDGDLDLFVANTGDNNSLYQNNGDGTFTKLTTGVVVSDGGTSWGSSWGDYNKDGFLDLFVANRGENNNDFLYLNNTNQNHWISIACVGTTTNTTAIGAKVSVKAIVNGSARWQLRQVEGQSGYASQNSLNAEFGLGGASQIDSIKVEWPSGIVQVFDHVQADRYISITEADSVITALEEAEVRIPKSFSLSQNYPNPFNPETRIRIILPAASQVILKVYNVLGQEIRKLVDKHYAAGSHNVQWDGKDDRGLQVPSGIYFYRLQAGDFSHVRKMSLVR